MVSRIGQHVTWPTHRSADKSALRARRPRAPPGREPADGSRRFGTPLLACPSWRRAACVAAYVARTGEPDTGPLLADLAARGVRVLLPVLLPDLDLDWAADDGTAACTPTVHGPACSSRPGRRSGRMALALADVVLVPALAVDRSGIRLGYGGGCYDRALARVAPGALVVALLHDGELTDEPLPAEPHDRPVDAVATPSGVVRLPPDVSGARVRGAGSGSRRPPWSPPSVVNGQA